MAKQPSNVHNLTAAPTLPRRRTPSARGARPRRKLAARAVRPAPRMFGHRPTGTRTASPNRLGAAGEPPLRPKGARKRETSTGGARTPSRPRRPTPHRRRANRCRARARRPSYALNALCSDRLAPHKRCRAILRLEVPRTRWSALKAWRLATTPRQRAERALAAQARTNRLGRMTQRLVSVLVFLSHCDYHQAVNITSGFAYSYCDYHQCEKTLLFALFSRTCQLVT